MKKTVYYYRGIFKKIKPLPYDLDAVMVTFYNCIKFFCVQMFMRLHNFSILHFLSHELPRKSLHIGKLGNLGEIFRQKWEQLERLE